MRYIAALFVFFAFALPGTASAKTETTFSCLPTGVGSWLVCSSKPAASLTDQRVRSALGSITPRCPIGELYNVTPPAISGTPSPGNTLSSSTGVWFTCGEPLVSLAYAWSLRGVVGSLFTVIDSDSGQSLTVTVNACNADACAASASAPVTISGGGGGGGSPPGVNLCCSQTVTTGAQTSLSWSSSGASNCDRSNGDVAWTGRSVGTSGGYTTQPLYQSTRYDINCYNQYGSTSASVTVIVSGPPPPAQIASFTASPSAITSLAQLRAGVTLSWSSNYSTGCAASSTPRDANWTGPKGVSGSQTLLPKQTVSYTLVCSGAGGDSSPVTLTVPVSIPAPTVSMTANPVGVTLGQGSTLTWTSTDAYSCTAVSGPWSGARAVNGTVSTIQLTNVQTYTWTLSCTGPGGTGQGSASVTVIDPNALPPNTTAIIASSWGDPTPGTFGVTINGYCRTPWVQITYKNKLTGILYFRWRLEVGYCWSYKTGLILAYPEPPIATSLRANYPWVYDRLITPPPSDPPVGVANTTIFAQAKYEACVAFQIGCVLSKSPWAKIVLNGNGTVSETWGVG